MLWAFLLNVPQKSIVSLVKGGIDDHMSHLSCLIPPIIFISLGYRQIAVAYKLGVEV